MLKKFDDSFFWMQHVQIRLNDISEHFYQKMHSHVAFCVIYTRLYVVLLRRKQFDSEEKRLWGEGAYIW